MRRRQITTTVSFTHEQDRHGDEQADDRVGQGETGPHPKRANQDGQGREAIGPGVLAVSHERCRTDLLAFTDAELGDRFVADEADQRRCHHPAQVVQRLGMDELAVALVGSDQGAQEDQSDDRHTGDIFGARVAVSVAPRRRASPPARTRCPEALPSGRHQSCGWYRPASRHCH